MQVYGNSFSDEDYRLSREYGLGLEITQYAIPAFLDDFENNHPQISRHIKGMSGVAMHGAYLDLFYTSKDPLIVNVAKKRFLKSMQAAAFHSIGSLVFHSVYRKYFDGNSKFALDDFVKKSIDFWQSFEENIPNGIIIYLENVEDDNPEVFAKMLEGINSPKIHCCLDIGHVFCNSPVPLANWVDILGGFIGHVHLSDNNGTYDNHLPLGKGCVPLFDTISSIQNKCGDIPFVLECNVKESMQWLKNAGFIT